MLLPGSSLFAKVSVQGFNSNQSTSVAEGWLLLRLEALFCSIDLLYEGLISILSKQSSCIYTESIRSNS